ncbi:HSP20-like chaperone, partial [Sistotremastrum suecicum HHB10207 ss-3]
RLDLHESKEKNLVTATLELPGVPKSAVNIDVQDRRLTVSGDGPVVEGDGFSVRERKFGSFRRSLRLPRGVKADQVSAKLEDGVLTVTYPRTN